MSEFKVGDQFYFINMLGKIRTGVVTSVGEQTFKAVLDDNYVATYHKSMEALEPLKVEEARAQATYFKNGDRVRHNLAGVVGIVQATVYSSWSGTNTCQVLADSGRLWNFYESDLKLQELESHEHPPEMILREIQTRKCDCDFATVIMVTGCRCGGL